MEKSKHHNNSLCKPICIPAVTLLLLILCANLQSQTKRIFHKSHSGSEASFLNSLKEEHIELASSNFGMAPQMLEQRAQLDSLIAINDSAVIMVTSCYKSRKTYGTERWKPGRDTVYNHPLFFMSNPVDTIKKILNETYYFRNPTGTIKFIGFKQKLQRGDLGGMYSWITSLLIIGAFFASTLINRTKLNS